MFEMLPRDAHAVMDWEWAQFAPYYEELAARPLDAETIDTWMRDWTRVGDLVNEMAARMQVATTQDTNDAQADARFRRYLDEIGPHYEKAQQVLKEKLLASGLEPVNFAVPLRKMRAAAALFREANLPLEIAENKLGLEYNRIVGSQTIEWDGEELTLLRARALLEHEDRALRESIWRRITARQLGDRDAINGLWQQLMDLRRQIAANADYEDYRTYRWQEFGRFDYTPEDCETFHAAIEEHVVPVATQGDNRHRELLGVDTLRPWDMERDDVYPPARPAIRPYQTIEELESTAEAIFTRVDPQLGDYFGIMRREGLLDLDNRKGKGPGGYCTYFATARRPFIFMNAVGLDGDVRTLLHEAGHCFHGFEASRLPYAQQRYYPIEFAEVASMSMELLSMPYWTKEEGGYYSAEDNVHAVRGQLERMILFWPYMALVDAFQHWVYTHHDVATDPAACDAQWSALVDRFIPGIDWTGLEAEKMTGWHRKLHIFRYPFYYVDYGLAQLGAVQVWRNAERDQAAAVRQYLAGLALGGTGTLHELFGAAGARFGFDSALVGEVVAYIQQHMDALPA